MLTLFSRKEFLFAHVRDIDTDHLPIVTGFDFYDRFLSAAAATDAADFTTYMNMKALDRDSLLQRYPFFSEILNADAETRVQAYILQRNLQKFCISRHEENKLFQHIAACILVLRDLCSQTNMYPISEKLSLAIVEELGQDLFHHVFVDMLIPSFPNDPPSALKKSLIALIDDFSDPVRPKAWSQIEQLKRLETFIGREPKNNPLIAEAASIVETSHEKGDELLSRISPIFREFYSDNAKVSDRQERERLSAKMDAYISAMSPEERGRFVSDIALIRKEFYQDPFWKNAARWHGYLPSFQLEKIKAIYLKSRGHQKVLHRKMVLTSDQAYLLLEDGLGHFGRGYELRVEFTSPVIRTLTKFMTPNARPDLIKAIGLGLYPNKKTKEFLLLAMLGETKEQEAAESIQRRDVKTKRTEVAQAFQTIPDLFYKLGNVYALDHAKQLPDDKELFVIDHQAFPYFYEINAYCDALARALQEGIDLSKEVEELKRFEALVRENLARLESGEGKHGTALQALTKDEATYRANYTRIPRRPDFRAPPPTKLERDEVVKAEYRMLEALSDWLRILSWYDDNRIFVQWRANVAPGDAASKPSAKWIKQAKDSFDPDAVLNYLAALEPVPGSVPITLTHELGGPIALFRHQTARFDKGVIWATHMCDPDKAGPLLVDYVKKCFVTLPGVGIKAEKLGNAALWALQKMPDGKGAPYLAHILARNKYPKVRKKISDALDAAAAEAGITRATLDELTAPDHEMADGLRRIVIGDGAAILTVEGSKVQLSWEDHKGVVRKAPPKAMKDMDPDGIKAAKGLAKEIEQDLATQSLRIDAMYLKQLSWSFDGWRSRYADHGTLGMLARRLIWRAELPGGPVTVLPTAVGCVDVRGNIVDCSGARMHLWHPIQAAEDEINAWRERLLDLGIQQPFKQVWREIYRLTAAEIETCTYSNRFAGHIVRQHQMMTLAQLNGWKFTHRMWVDAPNDEPSHIHLPDFDLYAEFWTQGAGGLDDPPVLDSQAYIYLTTDRLKFCRLDEAAPYGRGEDIQLEQVPALVFSEIMRHCDLFTSVPSISLDSEWLDRGENAEHPNQWHREVANPYWRQSQIADLGTSARMRHNVLAAILPRLKKSDMFTLDGQFLHVQGIRHQYAIHLGSGAVQLKPSARHICIVRAGMLRKADMKIHMPFEGDTILSIVLSKALMLAQDDKITDPVILRQLS